MDIFLTVLYQVSDFNYDKASGKYTLKDGIPYRGEKDKVQPGMLKFKNIDGSEDNKITEDDKTVIGNASRSSMVVSIILLLIRTLI